MSFLDFTLLFFLCLAVFNYRIRRSVLYPPFIFSFMWTLVLAVLRADLIDMDPVHWNTLAIVAAGATSFSFGGLLACFAPRRLLRIHLFNPKADRIPEALRGTVMIILLCGLPLMAYEILQLSRSVGGGLNLLAAARVALVETAENGESSRSFVLDYFTTVAILSSLLFATEKLDRKFWIVTGAAFLGCILGTGRTDLLLLISGLSGIRLLQTKQESLRYAMRFLRWPITLFLMLYTGLIFTNKSTAGLAAGATGIATYFIVIYLVGPLAGFDRVVQHPADFMLTMSHTFQFPLHMAALLHLTDYVAPPKIDSFVFVPFPTNVYTVFKFYFLELGVSGTMLLMLFVGFVHSLLYLKARQGGRFSTYLFAFSIYPVLMVIFDDHYYTISGYLRAIAFGVLYFAAGTIPFRLLPAMRKRRQMAPQNLD
jgi:oligosaccharide repeat unit polymerase